MRLCTCAVKELLEYEVDQLFRNDDDDDEDDTTVFH